ncbi:MAG: RNA methyltransferase [Planctomycetaceae bacterium]|nr:RNA methyltransferase [Planctomycetaceae bacterium]
MDLIATTSFGLEAVVARELKQLGYDDIVVEDGRVTFAGDEVAICRTNLWLRSAERVHVKLASFTATDFGELFDRTKELPWNEWLPVDACFPVSGTSIRSKLASVRNCQSLVKKAIAEQLKGIYQKDWFDEEGAEYPVEISILKDRVTLTLDTSGTGLHKRGYRKLTGIAPLRETLAAGLVQLSYWNRERPFLDPFCGTGTIPIEAALIGRNIAPGLNREFAAESWPRVPTELWDEARAEARDLEQPRPEFTLVATDVDDEALSMARYHAREAGVEEDIHFQQKNVKDLTTQRKYGCLITNPPYGQRMGEDRELKELYVELSYGLADLETWSIYVLTAYPDFERLIGEKADRRRKLYNARIACTYYQYFGPPPPRKGREAGEEP